MSVHVSKPIHSSSVYNACVVVKIGKGTTWSFFYMMSCHKGPKSLPENPEDIAK